MDALKEGVVEQVKAYFPIEGRRHTLSLEGTRVDDNLSPDDFRSQRRAKLRGRSWTVPLVADLKLTDNATGKVLDRSSVNLVSIPKMTQRYSYIVEGSEYQVDNLWKLKAGVYSRIKANGEIEAQWNLAKGLGFHVGFNPEKGLFRMRYGDSNIALYPLLSALGVKDEALKKAWGDAIFQKNKAVKTVLEMNKFHKAATGEKASSMEEAEELVRATFAETEMLPEVNKVTLGKPYDQVTGPALVDSATKLLGISRGSGETDSRDALMFKHLWGTEDFVADHLRKSKFRITRKVKNNLDRKDAIREIVGYGLFNGPVKSSFTSSSLAMTVPQINPLEMIAGRLKTTVVGSDEGGIASDHAITEEAKMVDPSHLGFLDSLETPESARAGVTLYLTMGARKKGRDPAIQVYDPKKHKAVERTPAQLVGKVIGFPDQYARDGNKLRARGDKVKVRDESGEVAMRSAKDVDYILPSAKMLFSSTANMVPFLSSDQGNRVGMATRHLEQAISLKGREAPLIQSATEVGTSFEDIYGKFMSTRSKESGTVTAVSADAIKIRTKGGKIVEHQLYDNFPLNDSRTGIWSEPQVKKGDKVEKGQLLADSSYTRGGTLSLGRNMNVAYLPWKGYNFEDGVVISETAATKLTSEHLYKEGLREDSSILLDRTKFRSYMPNTFTPEQLDKVDEAGLVKPGTILKPGDPIALVLKRKDANSTQAQTLARLHKSLVKPYSDKSQVWKHDFAGKVVEVSRHGKEVQILIRTEEPVQVGDKISGRHGNKGIIVQILPDHEMPHDKDGVPREILLGPTGVPGRINPGQVLETALSHAAMHDGKPFLVSNFESSQDRTIMVKGHWRKVTSADGATKQVWVKKHSRDVDYTRKVKSALDERGLSETTELFDPSTGKSLGQVLTGKQYILKLHHQMVKKLTSRSRGAYDVNKAPKKGGSTGAMSIGELGLYSLLSMGARHNIRDMSTYKSNHNEDVWAALQSGEALPPPTSPFAYEKFTAYLKAMGVDLTKDGNSLQLVPYSDKQIVAMSNGELADGGKMLRGKDLKPEKGGLFDPVLTGGPGGSGWTHIKLDEPMPNPLFERAIRGLLGLKQKELGDIVDGRTHVDGRTGGEAIVSMLQAIDEPAELKRAEAAIGSARTGKLDELNKKIKYLRALKKTGMSADEAYVLNHIPIIPPVMRPVTALSDGNLNMDDLNGLYKNLALINASMKQFPPGMPDEEKIPLRADLYDGMKSLFGLGGGMNRTHRGILDIITPTKTGFFQDRVVRRRQDMTLRSIIIPEPEMEIDEIGIPRKAALELYKPFVVREMSRMGFKPLEAQEEIKKRTPQVEAALERVVDSRPVIFKRDPALHKYNVMAFKPKLTEGMSLRIHPLVTGAYNADFDGDQMNVYVPVSPEAVKEAYDMMPSRNLFSFATGEALYQPTLDSLLGLHLATQWGKGKSVGSFSSHAQVKEASKKHNVDAPIVFKGVSTTIGRVLIDDALPRPMRAVIDTVKTAAAGDIWIAPHSRDGKQVKGHYRHLTDKRFVLNKGSVDKLFSHVAKNHPSDFGRFANKMKDIGFAASSEGFTFSLDDFILDRSARDEVLAKADVEVARIKAGSGSPKTKEGKIVAAYTKATEDLREVYLPLLDKKGNRLRQMHRAGIKPTSSQLEQILWAPGLVQDASGKTIPNPVRRSYSEGLDTGDYWLATLGTRKGLVDKVLQVRKPGALSKQVINSVMNQIVTSRDCGTTKGVAIAPTATEALDRYLAAPVKVRGRTIPAGELVTPELQTTLANAKLSSKILVRSPLRCQAKDGLCGRCYGLAEGGKDPGLGDNLGVSSAQAIGERTTQLSMRTFHSGGTAAAGGGVVGGFARVVQLLNIPKTLPNKAALATASGAVTKIEKDPAGGHSVYVGDVRHYVPQNNDVKVRKGVTVVKGDPLSSGPVHPLELLDLTNVHKVQGYLTDELFDVFSGEGIKRRNIEVVIKALTNLGKVDDPGDHPDYVRGDLVPTSRAEGWNRENGKKAKVKVIPVLKGTNMLPLDMQEDWMARLNYQRGKDTIRNAVQQGWKSDIHGAHPIPAVAFAKEFGQPTKGDAPSWAY
jgi:DNA-directed RNA polymerase subunit beta'